MREHIARISRKLAGFARKYPGVGLLLAIERLLGEAMRTAVSIARAGAVGRVGVPQDTTIPERLQQSGPAYYRTPFGSGREALAGTNYRAVVAVRIV
jgi:hypothetical protein